MRGRCGGIALFRYYTESGYGIALLAKHVVAHTMLALSAFVITILLVIVLLVFVAMSSHLQLFLSPSSGLTIFPSGPFSTESDVDLLTDDDEGPFISEDAQEELYKELASSIHVSGASYDACDITSGEDVSKECRSSAMSVVTSSSAEILATGSLINSCVTNEQEEKDLMSSMDSLRLVIEASRKLALKCADLPNSGSHHLVDGIGENICSGVMLPNGLWHPDPLMESVGQELEAVQQVLNEINNTIGQNEQESVKVEKVTSLSEVTTNNTSEVSETEDVYQHSKSDDSEAWLLTAQAHDKRKMIHSFFAEHDESLSRPNLIRDDSAFLVRNSFAGVGHAQVFSPLIVRDVQQEEHVALLLLQTNSSKCCKHPHISTGCGEDKTITEEHVHGMSGFQHQLLSAGTMISSTASENIKTSELPTVLHNDWMSKLDSLQSERSLRQRELKKVEMLISEKNCQVEAKRLRLQRTELDKQIKEEDKLLAARIQAELRDDRERERVHQLQEEEYRLMETARLAKAAAEREAADRLAREQQEVELQRQMQQERRKQLVEEQEQALQRAAKIAHEEQLQSKRAELQEKMKVENGCKIMRTQAAIKLQRWFCRVAIFRKWSQVVQDLRTSWQAAIVIQLAWRCSIQYKRWKVLVVTCLQKHHAALVIQSYFRGWRVRARVAHALAIANEDQNDEIDMYEAVDPQFYTVQMIDEDFQVPSLSSHFHMKSHPIIPNTMPATTAAVPVHYNQSTFASTEPPSFLSCSSSFHSKTEGISETGRSTLAPLFDTFVDDKKLSLKSIDVGEVSELSQSATESWSKDSRVIEALKRKQAKIARMRSAKTKAQLSATERYWLITSKSHVHDANISSRQPISQLPSLQYYNIKSTGSHSRQTKSTQQAWTEER